MEMQPVDVPVGLPPICVNFENARTMSKTQIRDFIGQLEDYMSKAGTPIEVPLQHYFADNVYAREVTLAKGTLVTGKIHKFQCMTILSKGEVSVLSIDGPMRIKAPATFISSPGVKRLVYAHEETVWTTVHSTTETDVDKIEELLIAKSYDEVIESAQATKIEVGV